MQPLAHNAPQVRQMRCGPILTAMLCDRLLYSGVRALYYCVSLLCTEPRIPEQLWGIAELHNNSGTSRECDSGHIPWLRRCDVAALR